MMAIDKDWSTISLIQKFPFFNLISKFFSKNGNKLIRESLKNT